MAVGLLLIFGGLLSVGCTLAYLAGMGKVINELDGCLEIAKALGAYGEALRIESDATGVPIDVLIERDQGNAS